MRWRWPLRVSSPTLFGTGHEPDLPRHRTGHVQPRVRWPGSAGQGLLLACVVDDLDAEFARIQATGARVVTPPETEPWGERYCQFADPNGLIWQLVQWVT